MTPVTISHMDAVAGFSRLDVSKGEQLTVEAVGGIGGGGVSVGDTGCAGDVRLITTSTFKLKGGYQASFITTTISSGKPKAAPSASMHCIYSQTVIASSSQHSFTLTPPSCKHAPILNIKPLIYMRRVCMMAKTRPETSCPPCAGD